MLRLYTIFHCNLAFSMIPASDYPEVVKRCYRPILDLCEDGFPIGIEMSAWTLREAGKADPGFVRRLKELCGEGKCEFIGSGHSQSILPLMPADVNRWNLEAGNNYYMEVLGRRPSIALVNEQTYSRGLVDLYKEAGYGAIVMDWNNPFQHNRFPKDYQYCPQRAAGIKGDIDLVWSNSIAFQKFQRCAHGEITVDEYLDYVFSHDTDNNVRAFALYTNDAEVFDYRPGIGVAEGGEFKKIKEIMTRLKESKRAAHLLPGAILKSFKGATGAFNAIKLESTESPIVCKKQEKYNPVRWAVAGRDSVHINTECYKVYENIKRLMETGVPEEQLICFKETLCELWGSDFRTNTIDEKFQSFQNRLGWLKLTTESLLAGCGKAAYSYAGGKTAFGPIVTGTTPAITKARRAIIEDSDNIVRVSTGTVDAEFIKNKGSAIKSVAFPQVSKMPLVGTIPHGFYEDIALGADFFSGHLINISKDGKKTADLKQAKIDINETDGSVVLSSVIPVDIGTLWKSFEISKTGPRISVTYRLKVAGLTASSLRLGIFTFLPNGFDRDSLWFETVNGGMSPERFYLKGHTIAQDEPVNQGVSASSCLGATEGWVRIGDSEKIVTVSTDKSRLFSVPMIKYTDSMEDRFFLRLYHSLGEVDDTAWWVWRGYNEVNFTVTAERNERQDGRARK
ncbi:MAG: hypothetical protein HY893_00275 [Deltaproteobacteria bacterium]|nr:hypothetical protein [Deltaproteobacteria bacterium]